MLLEEMSNDGNNVAFCYRNCLVHISSKLTLYVKELIEVCGIMILSPEGQSNIIYASTAIVKAEHLL